jgi:hypothetical protein
MVTSAHSVEIEVGADGHASTPPSGAAAAVPPAGACRSLVSRGGARRRHVGAFEIDMAVFAVIDKVDDLGLGGLGVVLQDVDMWCLGLFATLRRWCRVEGNEMLLTRSSGSC